MIQLNILYQAKENAMFDWEYYLNTHMPLSIKLHGQALKGVTIAKGLAGIQDAPVAHVAINISDSITVWDISYKLIPPAPRIRITTVKAYP